MNREELVTQVAKKTRYPKKHIDTILGVILETISKNATRKKGVMLSGFGTFHARKRSERNGRNPKTGAKCVIPSKRVPVFKAGKTFKAMVNKQK